MKHDEIHFNIGAGGYRSCICMCKDCFQMSGECSCTGCSCTSEGNLLPLHPAYNPNPKPAIQHPCKICGKEVLRKGNRGRWPSKCAECK